MHAKTFVEKKEPQYHDQFIMSSEVGLKCDVEIATP